MAEHDTHDQHDDAQANESRAQRGDGERVPAQKRRISGPGAADFLTAPGGEDRPETSPDKGTGVLRDASSLTNARNLIPDLEPGRGERGPLEGQDDPTVGDDKNR